MSHPGVSSLSPSLREGLRAAPTAAARGRPYARVRVASSIDAVAGAWDALEAIASVSPYQRRGWIDAWLGAAGASERLTTAIVVAEDVSGRPVAIVPLGVGGRILRTAVFLGGRETNYNMGLFDPSLAWTPGDAAALLREAARHMRPAPDMMVLIHQPPAWQGIANPLALLPSGQPSPSFSHMTALRPDGEALLRELLSSSARKKLRAKATHLAALGPVSHRRARTPAEVEAVIQAHLAQKAEKFAATGLPAPDTGALLQLFSDAATARPGAAAPLELHALHCGDEIVATFGGLAHQGRFSGLLISHAGEARFARCSPGELLLSAVIKAKSAEGFDSFDLGIGEARYKEDYCPVPEPLVDVFMPLTATGHAAALVEALRLRVKSAIKRSPRAWAFACAARRTLARLRRPAA